MAERTNVITRASRVEHREIYLTQEAEERYNGEQYAAQKYFIRPVSKSGSGSRPAVRFAFH